LAYFDRTLEYPFSSLAGGLVFGERSGFSDDFKRLLSVNGLMHVAAVSGSNINIFVASLEILMRFFSKRYVEIIGVVFVSFFCVMVGIYNYSALRAGIFYLFFVAAGLFGRRFGRFRLVTISLLLIFFVHPLGYRSVGLIFSTVAVSAVYFIQPVFAKKLPGPISSALAVGMVMAMLQLYYFEEFSILGIGVNIVVAPFISILMVVGVLVVFVNQVGDNLAGLVLILFSTIGQLFISMLGVFDDMDFLLIQNFQLSAWFVFMIILLFIFGAFNYYFLGVKSRLSRLSS
jgi:competence protein ComEC